MNRMNIIGGDGNITHQPPLSAKGESSFKFEEDGMLKESGKKSNIGGEKKKDGKALYKIPKNKIEPYNPTISLGQ